MRTAADLSEAALEQAVIDIAGFRDDRGLLIAAKPEKLVIPYQQQFEAKRILGADGRVGTDLNDPNVLKDMGIFSNVVTNHYLTDADAWFILTNVKDGLKYFERRGDQFEMDNDFDTENAKFKATARYSFGWSDPRAIYGSTRQLNQMGAGIVGPAGVTTITPAARDPYVKMGVITVADGSTGFAAFGLPKYAVPIGVYTICSWCKYYSEQSMLVIPMVVLI